MSEIMFPVGRMVGGGSLYKMFAVTDKNGAPKLNKDGSPQMKCNFGVAIPKDPAFPHWSQTPWGQKVAAVAQAGFPNGEFNHPSFAWKIIDGDSKVPNKKGNVPANQTAYPGSWVIWFSQSWLPKLCNADGSQVLTQEDAIVPGYYVQVLADVKDNKPSESPGVYMNPSAVALAGYAEKIAGSGEVNTATAGFGGQPLPAGASAAPIGQMSAPAPVALSIPGLAMPAPVAAAPAPAPVAVAPNTAYMAAPAPVVPAVPAAPAAPAVPVAPRTVSKDGQSALYDDMIKQGWTDALMAQHGWV